MKEFVLLVLFVLALSRASDSSVAETTNDVEQGEVANTDGLDTQNATSSGSPEVARETNSASSRTRPRPRQRQSSRPRHRWRHWRRHRRPSDTTAGSQAAGRRRENTSRLGQHQNRRSPFQDAHTAHNFLTSNLQTRVTRNERIRENRALNADMAETMCEVFNKHFYPNALGGRCL